MNEEGKDLPIAVSPEIQRVLVMIEPGGNIHGGIGSGRADTLQEAMRKDIQSNVMLVLSFAGNWERPIWREKHPGNGYDPDQLVQAGFMKIGDIYSEELDIVDDVLNKEVLERERVAKVEKGVEPTLTKYVEKYRHILHEVRKKV